MCSAKVRDEQYSLKVHVHHVSVVGCTRMVYMYIQCMCTCTCTCVYLCEMCPFTSAFHLSHHHLSFSHILLPPSLPLPPPPPPPPFIPPQANILFPDYGNQDSVSISNLQTLPSQFYKLPFQVHFVYTCNIILQCIYMYMHYLYVMCMDHFVYVCHYSSDNV